jgi:hypothetical protein
MRYREVIVPLVEPNIAQRSRLILEDQVREPKDNFREIQIKASPST